jgi:DNA-binding NtrC family response regulator
MGKTRVLVVDDEVGMLEVCAETLSRLPDIVVQVESDGRRAGERLTREPFDLLIQDIRMPGADGMELLRLARRHDPDLAVLMMTAYPTVETAVESMKLGAADYITKPFTPEDLLASVQRLLEGSRLRRENLLLSRQIDRPYVFDKIIGASAAMRAVFDAIERIAATNADVLILGETGTGKELVARSIHGRSPRAGQRFVPVDCGAIPEDLLESELFGHERGAFTGATSRSLGLLEFADKGTFFLDEVGEMPIRLQAKLLRALQERRIRRVGGNDEIDVDVRVIAATSRNLEAEIAGRRFRDDLYYRLNVARIDLPPLRRRNGDIPLMVEHFVQRYAREMGKASVVVDDQAMEVLVNYGWPGNVRELQNILQRTLLMARSAQVGVEDLPDEVVVKSDMHAGEGAVQGFFALREHRLAAFEQEYLTHLLRSYRGDVAEAAREANLPRGTLYRLIKKHELNPVDFR